jgi:hypothetical protein
MRDSWDGMRMQAALLGCEIVREHRITDAGPGEWLYLKLDDRLIPLGRDEHFADMLRFALQRNAEAFEAPRQQKASALLD